MERKYCIIVIQNESDGILYGYMPDFTLSASESSAEDIVMTLTQLAQTYIDLANKHGQQIPFPTSLDKMQEKWSGFTVSQISVQV